MNKITPEEVAERIYNEFDMIIYTDQDHYNQVKKCSNLMVSEIIFVLGQLEAYDERDFYREVRSEIERM